MKNKSNDEKLKNFLPLNRKFFDHPFWEEKRVYSKAEAWLDLLQKANFKDTQDRLQIGYKTVKWATGQVPISYRYLATRWQWGHGRIKTFLDYLVKEGMISLETNNGQTILTLLNFQKYNKPGARSESSNPRGSAVAANLQKIETQNGTPAGTVTGTPNDTLQPASVLDLTEPSAHQSVHQTEQGISTPTGTPPEQDRNKSNNVLIQDNNLKTDNTNTGTLPGAGVDNGKNLFGESENKRGKKKLATAENLQLPWPSHDFSKKWAEWIEYRRIQKRKTYKHVKYEQRAVDDLVTLSGGNEIEAIAIIDHAMVKDWGGLFPIKKDKPNGTPKPIPTTKSAGSFTDSW